MRVMVRTAVVAVGLPRGGLFGRGVDMIALVPRQRMQTATPEEGDPSLEDEHGDGEETLHGEWPADEIRLQKQCSRTLPGNASEGIVKNCRASSTGSRKRGPPSVGRDVSAAPIP